jgi:hypothetical protein
MIFGFQNASWLARSRSVWTAVALAPLLVRAKTIRIWIAIVLEKAPLKPAQSRRFATANAASKLES